MRRYAAVSFTVSRSWIGGSLTDYSLVGNIGFTCMEITLVRQATCHCNCAN